MMQELYPNYGYLIYSRKHSTTGIKAHTAPAPTPSANVIESEHAIPSEMIYNVLAQITDSIVTKMIAEDDKKDALFSYIINNFSFLKFGNYDVNIPENFFYKYAKVATQYDLKRTLELIARKSCIEFEETKVKFDNANGIKDISYQSKAMIFKVNKKLVLYILNNFRFLQFNDNEIIMPGSFFADYDDILPDMDDLQSSFELMWQTDAIVKGEEFDIKFDGCDELLKQTKEMNNKYKTLILINYFNNKLIAYILRNIDQLKANNNFITVPAGFFKEHELPDAYEFITELVIAIRVTYDIKDALNVTKYYDDSYNEKTIEFINGKIAPTAAIRLALMRIFLNSKVKEDAFINPETFSYYKDEKLNKNQFDLLIPKANLALENGFNSFGAVILKGGEGGNTGHYVAFHAQKDAKGEISYYLIDSFSGDGVKKIGEYLKRMEKVDVTCYGTGKQTDWYSCGVHAMYNIIMCANFGVSELNNHKLEDVKSQYEEFNRILGVK